MERPAEARTREDKERLMLAERVLAAAVGRREGEDEE